MLIKRLINRWLMEGESGDAPAGGAPAAAPAAAPAGDAGNGGAAPSDGSSSAPASSSPASSTPTDSAAAGGEIANPLAPPASIVGESKEGETPEAPADGEKPAEAPADDKPIEYTDFTLPEGVEADADLLAAFKETAAGAKLTQEQAQGFVDMYQKAVEKAAAAPYEIWRDTQKAWQDEIKADPEFGGAKLEKETIPSIARVIKAYSPSAEAEAALRQAFHFTGAGNHPEMIRFLARIGNSLKEGSHVSGGPTSSDGGKSAASKLYPSTAGNGQS